VHWLGCFPLWAVLSNCDCHGEWKGADERLRARIDSDNIYEAGEYLYEWDSVANTCSQLEAFGADSLGRSADHKWAVFSSDQFYLYSSDTNSMQRVSVNTVNPPNNEFGVRGYAINADGSEIAVASANQVTFLNNALTALASTPIPDAFQTARTAVQFGADGQTLYLQYDMPLEIEEINASSYSALGYITGDVATLETIIWKGCSQPTQRDAATPESRVSCV